MAIFRITQQDLVMMSVAAHICVLVELLAKRVVGWLAPVLSKKWSLVRTLTDLHDQKPGLLAKVLTEQITLCCIIVLILVALTFTSVSVTPFSHQPLPYPKFLIRVILNANIARFVVMATRIVLVRDLVRCLTEHEQATPGQSGNTKLDFIYNVTGAINNLICLGYNENLLLGVTSAVMEVSSIPQECCRLIESSKRSKGSRSYRKTTILNFVICFFCRILLPLMLLILATRQESPFKMNAVPLVSFFISGFFYTVFNSILFYHSISRMRLSSSCQQLTSKASSTSIPFTFQVLSIETSQKNAKGEAQSPLKELNNELFNSPNNINVYCTLETENTDKFHCSVKGIAKNSNEDFIKKFSFPLFSRKVFAKSQSEDLLLGSQELSSSKESDIVMVDRDSDRSNFEQSDINYDCMSHRSEIKDFKIFQKTLVDYGAQNGSEMKDCNKFNQIIFNDHHDDDDDEY